MLKHLAIKERVMWQVGGKQPFPALFMAIGGMFILGLALLAAGVGQDTVLWVVARALWTLVPGIAWLGATAVSLAWLLLVARVWRR